MQRFLCTLRVLPISPAAAFCGPWRYGDRGMETVMWIGGCGIGMFCATGLACISEVRSSGAAGSSIERQCLRRQRAIRHFADEDSARTSDCGANGEFEVFCSERTPVGHGRIRCGDDAAMHCRSPLQGRQSFDALIPSGTALRELCAGRVEHGDELLAQETLVKSVVDPSGSGHGRSRRRRRHWISASVRRGVVHSVSRSNEMTAITLVIRTALF